MNRLPLWPALSLVVAQQRSTGALDTKSIANKVPKTPAKMRLPPDLVCFRRPRVKLYQRRPTTDSAAHPSYALYSAIGASRERPDSGRSRARALRQPTEVTLVITRNHPEHGPCSPSADAEHALGARSSPTSHVCWRHLRDVACHPASIDGVEGIRAGTVCAGSSYRRGGLSGSRLVHIAPYLDGRSARRRHADMRSMRRSCSVNTHRLDAPLNSRPSGMVMRRSEVRAAGYDPYILPRGGVRSSV